MSDDATTTRTTDTPALPTPAPEPVAPAAAATPVPAEAATEESPAAAPAKRKVTQPFAEFHQVQIELQWQADPELTARTLAEAKAAQEAEYGRYVAATPIDLGGARAFNVGDAVPVGHVSDTGPVYPGQVALRPSPEQLAAAADPGEMPAGNATTEEWRAYAKTHGVPAEQADAAGRDELRARFAG